MRKKAEERAIDLFGVPVDHGANRRGVGMGPTGFRLAGLREQLVAEGMTVVDRGDVGFPHVRPRERVQQGHGELRGVCEQLAEEVHRSLRRGRFPLVIGGDHSIAIGSIAGASSYFRERKRHLGVLWIDAHGDMNTPATSPSGNIHGMPLATSLGHGYRDLVRLAGFAPKIEPTTTALVAVRNLDASERENMARLGVHVFTMKEIDRRGLANVLDEALAIVTQGTGGVHVSYDMDAIDPEVAPGVGTAVPGGLSYREAHLVMELLHDAEVMTSLDVVETNPFLDVRNTTARLGVELILSALGKSIY